MEITANITATNFDSAEHPHLAQKKFILCNSANVGVFLLFLLLPRLIRLWAEEFDFDEFFIITIPASIALPYAAGFMSGYSAAKLFRIYCSSGKTSKIENRFRHNERLCKFSGRW